MCESLWTEQIAVIQQGAQYYLPFKIHIDGDLVTPDNSDDVIIQIGGQSKKASADELEFSDEHWLYPLTQKFTMNLQPDGTKCQISVKRGIFVYPSTVRRIGVDSSIIKELF